MLGLDKWLLNDLHIILVVLSCGLLINADRFGEFCKYFFVIKILNNMVSQFQNGVFCRFGFPETKLV